MPEHDRILRRERRRAWRGIPTGRRVTHEVRTAYGRKQKARDWLAARNEAIAAATAAGGGGGGGGKTGG